MPLALDDPLWSKLKSAYGDCDDVVEFLGRAYAKGISDDLLGDIINEIQHQGDTSSGMYAVAPHLLELAQKAKPQVTRNLLIHIGLIVAASQLPSAVKCPTFLAKEFDKCRDSTLVQLSSLLPKRGDFDEFKFFTAALAGLLGHGRFSQVLEGFDYFEDKFHHPQLDAPFPEFE